MSAPAIALYTGPPGGVSQLQSAPTCAASTSSSKTISGGLSMLFSSFPLHPLPPTHSHIHRSFNHPGHLLCQFRRQDLSNRRRASASSAASYSDSASSAASYSDSASAAASHSVKAAREPLRSLSRRLFAPVGANSVNFDPYGFREERATFGPSAFHSNSIHSPGASTHLSASEQTDPSDPVAQSTNPSDPVDSLLHSPDPVVPTIKPTPCSTSFPSLTPSLPLLPSKMKFIYGPTLEVMS